MKKNYLNFIVPLAATAVFAVYYTHYSKIYDARLARMDEQKQIERKQKLEEEAKARQKAVDEAIALTEKRKKEKAEREARDEQEREKRELAQQALRKAEEDSRKYQDQVKQLQQDVADNKEQIAKIDRDKKDLAQEEEFLRGYVKQADANTQYLTTVMEKIEAADRARAAAAAAAAKKRS